MANQAYALVFELLWIAFIHAVFTG